MKHQSSNETFEDLGSTLIMQLRQGDTTAGLILDQLYREALHRFCLRWLGQKEQAEDAVQDVFHKVLTSSQIPDNFRAWLYKIARNLCIDRLRSRQRQNVETGLPASREIKVDLTGNLSRLVKQESRDHLIHLLDTLTSEQREVLWLRYTVGLARIETAEVLELRESVVKSRLFEGIECLRNLTKKSIESNS